MLLSRPASAMTVAPKNDSPNGAKPKAAKRVGCRVCVSSTCVANGSEMLLEALETLTDHAENDSKDDVAIDEANRTTYQFKSDYCLGGCCQGVVVKPFGVSKASSLRRKIIKGTLTDERAAIEAAQALLSEWNIPMNEAIINEVTNKIDSGEKVLQNSEAPEVCQNCGVALQLYRGNCAKCGKYPY